MLCQLFDLFHKALGHLLIKHKNKNGAVLALLNSALDFLHECWSQEYLGKWSLNRPSVVFYIYIFIYSLRDVKRTDTSLKIDRLLGNVLNGILVRHHLVQRRHPQYELPIFSPFRDNSNKNNVSKVQSEN